ncbi:uncharacterized protein [Diadema antillarum]|uniref:uncharacterized protein n=1 Tax=Diadema antillarum TaxID=105358 RepID=UPI003A8A787B
MASTASMEEALEYFKRLYLTFKDEIAVRSPNRKQFAAFSLDLAGLYPDRPIFRGQEFGDGGLLSWDFAVATCSRSRHGQVEHAEQRILCHLISNLEDMAYLNDADHTLLLFSFYSPCEECSIFIEQLLRGLRKTLPRMTTILGYVEMYVGKEDRKLTSEATSSMDTLGTLYKLKEQFSKFDVLEIPNVVHQDSFIGKLYVKDD